MARLAAIVEGAAQNHIMSFMHLKAVRSDEDYEELEQNEDGSKEPHHDLRWATWTPTTTITHDETVAIATKLRGEVVKPTSSKMTLAYYLKAYHASRQNHRGDKIRAPTWQEIPYENNPTNQWLFGGMPGRTYGNAKPIHTVWPFSDDEQGRYRFENRKEFRNTNAQSVWIPGLLKSTQWPKHIKSNKSLHERLKKISAHLKPIKDVENKDLNKPNKLTPLTEYYLMRYLAPWLIESGWVDQAMPKFSEATQTVVVQAINIERSTSNTELDDDIARMITDMTHESKTPIDEMFAFERIRTTYEYPANYPTEHIDDNGNISQPNPSTEDVEITYGILQKMYAIQSASERKNMIQQTKQWVLDQAVKSKIRRPSRGEQFSPVLGKGSNRMWYPVGRGNDLGTAEATLVWLEETEEERKFQNEDPLKLPTDLNSPNEKEQISEGANIVVPGLLLLMAEAQNEHVLYDAISEATTRHLDTNDLWGGAINRRTETDYVIALSELTTRPGIILDLADDEDQAVEAQQEYFREIISNSYEGIYMPINANIARFIMTDEEGVFSTLHLNPKILSKTYGISDLEGKFNFELHPHLSDTLGDDLRNVAWNTEVKKDRAEEMAISAYASDTGITLRKARRFAAKAFNALGYLVEEQMVQSAQEAVRTIRGMPTSSDFDKMIAALIGTPKNPGLATAHATMHYQYMWMQLRSPVKKWDIVEEKEFEQGAMLAIESFLDQPALKAIYWMLNEKGFIDIGDFKGRRPQFFKMTTPAQYSEAQYTALQNAFATVVIGYYRLMFSQIRQRLVAHKKGKEGASSGAETVNINRYWKELMKDAAQSPPNAAIFGMVLRFFTKAPPTQRAVLQIPTWMPVMPESMRDAKNVKTDPKGPLNYLKWAYGTDPISLESFSEIAAAYHSAKALSYHDDYPHMLERFVNAVMEDKGAAFLFAILNRDETPDLTAEPVLGTPVTLTSFVDFMNGATPDEDETDPNVPPQIVIGDDYNSIAFQAAIAEAMKPKDWSELTEENRRSAQIDFISKICREASGSLRNLDVGATEEHRNAIFDLLHAHVEPINELYAEKIIELRVQIEEGVVSDEGAADRLEYPWTNLFIAEEE